MAADHLDTYYSLRGVEVGPHGISRYLLLSSRAHAAVCFSVKAVCQRRAASRYAANGVI
jgi:hypothetical protein